jgi:hypothetical protein
MTGGTQPFHLSKDKPYPISSIDAPVVSRVLEAGGTITGTSTCENYCLSALSFSSATGPVDNPWLKGYECGGSSSGSAALVGVKSVKRQREKEGRKTITDEDLGEGVDLAIGGDQGGSIRMVSVLPPSLALHNLTDHPASSVQRDLRPEANTRPGPLYGNRISPPHDRPLWTDGRIRTRHRVATHSLGWLGRARSAHDS